MKTAACYLEGILIIEPTVFADNRGFFIESFENGRYREAGITDSFVQDNHSRSFKDVLRGLHFTKRRPQAQLLTVMHGRIFDVVVDLRKNSSTFGGWFGTELSSEEGFRQVYMPPGFAHGFCVLSDVADLHYKVSQSYDPADEWGLRWDDPDVGITWPVRDPKVSPRDREHPFLRDL